MCYAKCRDMSPRRNYLYASYQQWRTHIGTVLLLISSQETDSRPLVAKTKKKYFTHRQQDTLHGSTFPECTNTTAIYGYIFFSE